MLRRLWAGEPPGYWRSARSACTGLNARGPELLIGGYVPGRGTARRRPRRRVHGPGRRRRRTGWPRCGARSSRLDRGRRAGRPRWVASSYVALGPEADAQAATYIRRDLCVRPGARRAPARRHPDHAGAVARWSRDRPPWASTSSSSGRAPRIPSCSTRLADVDRRGCPTWIPAGDGARRPHAGSMTRCSSSGRCCRPQRRSRGRWPPTERSTSGWRRDSLGLVAAAFAIAPGRLRAVDRADASTVSAVALPARRRSSSWRRRAAGLAVVDSVPLLLVLLAAIGLAQLVFVVANQTAVATPHPRRGV